MKSTLWRSLFAVSLFFLSTCYAEDYVNGRRSDTFEITNHDAVPEPSVSAVNSARLYYNFTLQKFMISVNGGAYTEIGGGGVSDLGNLTDVNLTGVSDLKILKYNITQAKFIIADDNVGAPGGSNTTWNGSAGSTSNNFTSLVSGGEIKDSGYSTTDATNWNTAYNNYFNKTRGNWKVFYSNDTGVIIELALGDANTYLKGNGATAAPTWEAIAAGGNISGDGGMVQTYFPMFNATGVIKNSTYSTADAVNWNTAFNNYLNKSEAFNASEILVLDNLTNYFNGSAMLALDNLTNYFNGSATLALENLTNYHNKTYSNATFAPGVLGRSLDGGNATLVVGSLNRMAVVAYNMTITGWSISSNKADNVTCEVWYNATAIPTVADKISASAPIKLTSEQVNVTGDVSTWTTSLVKNGRVIFNITAVDSNYTEIILRGVRVP